MIGDASEAMMVGLRRLLYKLARLLGDVNVVRWGRVAPKDC